ncbi:MAG: hypothetical protein MOP51_1791 [Citricoccus sp.]|nr:hypothetical protein [Citricoccus sp. WCRC_4]
MNPHSSRPAIALRAVLGTGLLALALTACGGSGAEEETTPAPPPESAAASATEPAPEATPSASATQDGAASGIEAALKAVLGEQAQIVSGERLQQLTESTQGMTAEMTVTPEECGQQGLGAQTGRLPEGTELVGGIVVDTEDPASPASDMLSVTLFPDAAAAAAALDDYEEFARTCSSYTIGMGEGMTAEATLELADVEADADAALAMTIGTSVSIEDVELPEGTESSTSTTLYVQDGERLVTYAGSRVGDQAVPVGEGLEKVESLRAQLDG